MPELGAREWSVAYRAALAVLRVRDQAEDAAQDALLRAYRARDTFTGRSQPDRWISAIARNTAITHLRRPVNRRRARDRVEVLLEQRADPAPSPFARVAAGELAGELATALEALSELDRVAFEERFLCGSTERELGARLGVSNNAARQRAFRARRRVRSLLSGAPSDRFGD